MMVFLAKFVSDEGGFLVTFPDVPEAISGGADREEAERNARDALEVALLTYALDGRDMPSATEGEGVSISISARVAVKIAFIEAFNASGLTRVELARRLGKAENEVRRMLDPYHHTKLASMEAGLRALGKQLVVSVADAA